LPTAIDERALTAFFSFADHEFEQVAAHRGPVVDRRRDPGGRGVMCDRAPHGLAVGAAERCAIDHLGSLAATGSDADDRRTPFQRPPELHMTTIQYAARADAQPFGADALRSRAGFWRRLGAHVIDVIAINILTLPLAFLHGGVLSLVGFVVVYAAYYTSLEGGAYGQTIGKMALGIRVADMDGGGSIGYGRAFGRAFGRIPSGMVVFLGYLWMLWDPEKQTWHDKMVNSAVVHPG
jgi:uncharacterized RDD family membrane protein YckC